MSRRFTVEEWAEIGRQLEMHDPERFDRVAETARMIVDAYRGVCRFDPPTPVPPPKAPPKPKRARKNSAPPAESPPPVPAPVRLAPPPTDRAWTEIGNPKDRAVLAWPTEYSAIVGGVALREYGPGARIFAGWGFTLAVRS